MTEVARAASYEYEFHPASGWSSKIEGEEFDTLVESISKRGILNPITRHEGKIIDGRNRYLAAKACGHKFTERDFRDLAPGIDPEDYVISQNAHRRQMSGKEKREFIARLIDAKPTASDRALAKLASVDNKTVASVREEMKHRGEAFLKSWGNLIQTQRQEFVTAQREELARLMGNSSPHNTAGKVVG
jgi:hypothetical protein